MWGMDAGGVEGRKEVGLEVVVWCSMSPVAERLVWRWEEKGG